MEGAYQLGWHPRPERLMAVSGQEDLANPVKGQRVETPEVKASVRENPGECTGNTRLLQTSKPIKHGLY